MNNWAERFLIIFCGFALIAVLVVPLTDNGASPLILLVSNLK